MGSLRRAESPFLQGVIDCGRYPHAISPEAEIQDIRRLTRRHVADFVSLVLMVTLHASGT